MLVGASDGSIRMIDLQTFYILSCFSHPQYVRGDIVSLSFHALIDVIGHTATLPGLGLSNPSVMFVADGGGTVTCAVALTSSSWDVVSAWDGTEHCETKQTFVANSAMSDEKFLERVVKGGGNGLARLSDARTFSSSPSPLRPLVAGEAECAARVPRTALVACLPLVVHRKVIQVNPSHQRNARQWQTDACIAIKTRSETDALLLHCRCQVPS